MQPFPQALLFVQTLQQTLVGGGGGSAGAGAGATLETDDDDTGHNESHSLDFTSAV